MQPQDPEPEVDLRCRCGLHVRVAEVTDPRVLPKDPDGLRAAWAVIADAWSATVVHAQSLPADLLSMSVNGEWSFIETLRHLIFVSDVWVRRTVLSTPHPYHLYGLPPDDDVDVLPWGIDVKSTPTFDEVLAARRERMGQVDAVFDGLTADELARVCDQHPEPGFPPVTTFPVRVCLDIVVSEEWAHHEYAIRDLALVQHSPD